jgi:hypothetical protein
MTSNLPVAKPIAMVVIFTWTMVFSPHDQPEDGICIIILQRQTLN